jgi:hypothetical protein
VGAVINLNLKKPKNKQKMWWFIVMYFLKTSSLVCTSSLKNVHVIVTPTQQVQMANPV